MVRFDTFQFYPVIQLPPDYAVFDFTNGYDPAVVGLSRYGIGRYDERRRAVYDQPLFAAADPVHEPRDLHVGVDIAAPAGTKIRAFYAGTFILWGVNAQAGDYGPTLITEHSLGSEKLYALWGHLNHASLDGKISGGKFSAGEVIAEVGNANENGGYPPHLHFQLSWERPVVADMPGVVRLSDRLAALEKYPDPRLVLGPLY